MGSWWPHRGTLVLGTGGRLWGIILAHFRCANEEAASSAIRSLLLCSRRTRATRNWIWELDVGCGGAGHSPSCRQPSLCACWRGLHYGCCSVQSCVVASRNRCVPAVPVQIPPGTISVVRRKSVEYTAQYSAQTHARAPTQVPYPGLFTQVVATEYPS